MRLVLLLLYTTTFKSESSSELRIIGTNGTHACLGKNLTFECTMHGGEGDSTVWQGTAFSGCNNNEITLIHNRFARESASGVCNDGAITGRSVRVESNFSYISQLEVVVTAEMVEKSIVCNRDNGTIYTIGQHLIKIVSSWPVIIDPQLTATVTSTQLSFSWVPAVSDCPSADIHYYILSVNCGSCPSITADTSITCIDVPSCGLCILALQTAVSGEGTVKDLLSDPIYVSLNQTSNCASNNSEIITGSNVKGINISFTIFVASIASTAVLAVALTLCVTVAIITLRFTIKKKRRSLKSLQRANTERHHQAAETRVYVYEEVNTHHPKFADIDCMVTLENKVYMAGKQ